MIAKDVTASDIYSLLRYTLQLPPASNTANETSTRLKDFLVPAPSSSSSGVGGGGGGWAVVVMVLWWWCGGVVM